MKLQAIGYPCVTMAFLLASAAHAQDMSSAAPQGSSPARPAATQNDGGIADIVVTAQKRSENLQSVPIAVTAVSGERLAASGVTNTAQLGSLTPGLSLSFTAGNLQPHLRGIGTTSNGPGVENPVALYIDGVYYASQLGALSDLDNVSQIAVLKGPQGTLFGRNATGGVIQVTTRDPGQDFEFDVKTSLDNYLTSRNNIYVGGPLGDRVSANLSASYTHQGRGWGENINTGEDIHRINDQVSLRGKIVFEPTDTTTIRINGDYNYRKDTLGPNYRPYPGTVPLIRGYRNPSDIWDVDVSVTNRNRLKGGGVSATIEQDLGFAKLVNITAFRKLRYHTIIVPTAAPQPGEVLVSNQPQRQFTEELQLVSPSGPFTWTAGLFYYRESGGVEPIALLFEGPPLLQPGGLQRIDIRTHEKTRSLAGFGQATWEFLPNTNLTGGIRYTSEDRYFTGGLDGFLQGNIPIGPLMRPIDAKIDFSKFTYRIALDHHFDNGVLLYASMNTGFKSGGFNGFDPTNPPYGPETLKAYEAGVKSQLFGNRLRLNGAGYYYRYSNIQVSRYTDTAVIYNGAGAEVYGIDLDAEARLTERLRLNAGLAWTHATFTKFPDAQFSTPLPTGGAILFPGNAKGNDLPFAPRFTAETSLEYIVPLSSGQLSWVVSNSYNSGYYGEPDNFMRQKDFDLLNASVSWTSPDTRFTAKAFVNNIFKEEVASLFATLNIGHVVDYANPPRIFGLSLSYKFGRP